MGVAYKLYLLPRDNTFRPSAEDLARLVEAWIANRYVPEPDGNALPDRAAFTATNQCGQTITIRDRRAEQARSSGAYFMVRTDAPQPLPLDNSVETFLDRLSSPEILFVWPIPDTKALGIQYPLRAVPDMGEPDIGPYLELRIEIADDYVYRGSECIDPLASTKCKCGAELSYEPDDDEIFYAGRIKRICPSCGAAFCPQDHAATLRDGASGARTIEMGGAVSRFAIVIDCGKAFEIEIKTTPDGGAEPMAARAAPSFLRLCEAALGTTLYEVGDFY